MRSNIFPVVSYRRSTKKAADVASAIEYVGTQPSTGQATIASANFTIRVNGSLNAPVTATPTSTGGTFSPSSVSFPAGAATTRTFTFTAATAGVKQINITNNGALGVPGAISFTASPAPTTANTITITGPTSGTVGVASGAFTASVNGNLAGPVTFTPSSASGTFSPTSVTFPAGASPANQIFTFTPSASGSLSITWTNSGGLTMSPASMVFTAAAAPSLPSGPVTQYLTSDGGATTSELNYSGPTRDLWHNRLGAAWDRVYADTNPLYGLGNWRDAAQVAEGPTPFASSGVLSAAGQVVSLSVLSLVQRWLGNGNRGALLRSRGSAWPVQFYGRTAAAPADRPKLTITTTAGTFTLTAAANATWNKSSFIASGSAALWRLSADQQNAILRFDLSTVTGTVQAATLTFKVESLPNGGSFGHIIDVYEADPPTLTDPSSATSGGGLAGNYANFNALKASGDPALIFADDFESPGWADAGFIPAATRTLNSDTGTIYARGTILAGNNDSASIRRDVAQGTGPNGTPNTVVPELFGQYWLYLENDFGSNIESEIKIPAMGVQFGYWNDVGYWQQTTGNGGNPGTGLKVWNASVGKWEYQGHSIRLLTGIDPGPGDDDPYIGYFGVKLYPYNLDQGGSFPAGEQFPRTVIKRGQWYCFDIRVKQNTMSGAQDADGNYATANADGVYQTWINGYLVYSKTTFRWRRHAEFGVQGMWIDVYHGGNLAAPTTMHYRVDRVSLATSYIGPPQSALPSWVPAAGNVAVLTRANGGLANGFRDAVAPYYDTFGSVKVANSYGGGVKNKYWGTWGCTMHFSGGHSNTNDNSVIVSEYRANDIIFKRITNPVPWYGIGTDGTTRFNNAQGPTNTWLDAVGDLSSNGYMVYGEAANLPAPFTQFNGQPGASHTYGIPVVIGPEYGGATYGTFLKAQNPAVGVQNFKGAIAAHALPLTRMDAASNTTLSDALWWQRHTQVNNPFNDRLSSGSESALFGAPALHTFVPLHGGRIYITTRGNSSPQTLWYDITAGQWVKGTGTPFQFNLADSISFDAESGAQFYVPERGLLICAFSYQNNVRIEWMDITPTQPTRGGAATLSQTLTTLTLTTDPDPTRCNWGAATWCPHNSRIILAGVNRDEDAAFEVEIPTVLTDPWPVTRAPFGNGVKLYPNFHTTHHKFQYDEKLRAITWMPRAYDDTTSDTVWVYRPRNT